MTWLSGCPHSCLGFWPPPFFNRFARAPQRPIKSSVVASLGGLLLAPWGPAASLGTYAGRQGFVGGLA
eukprot:1233580-Pyramimonas_sp.AAC.1